MYIYINNIHLAQTGKIYIACLRGTEKKCHQFFFLREIFFCGKI